MGKVMGKLLGKIQGSKGCALCNYIIVSIYFQENFQKIIYIILLLSTSLCVIMMYINKNEVAINESV